MKIAVQRWRWAWYTPPGEASAPDWLCCLRSFRSEQLFDEGRRPAFGPGGRLEGDPDPVDAHSHHVAAWDDQRLAAVVRVTPLASGAPCQGDAILGASRFAELLARASTSRPRCAEIGRWIVARELRDTGVGECTLAAASVVGLCAGCTHIYGAAGLRDGQAQRLVAFGAERAAGAESVYVPAFDDEVGFIIQAIERMRFQGVMRELGALLPVTADSCVATT